MCFDAEPDIISVVALSHVAQAETLGFEGDYVLGAFFEDSIDTAGPGHRVVAAIPGVMDSSLAWRIHRVAGAGVFGISCFGHLVDKAGVKNRAALFRLMLNSRQFLVFDDNCSCNDMILQSEEG